MERPRDDRSLADLFTDLLHDTSTLIRQEIRLAKAELTQNATEAGRNIGAMVAGGAVIYAGVLAILAAIILGLIQIGVTPWLSALLVGIIVAATGYLLVSRARKALSGASLVPSQTVESLKEDKEWAKEQVR